MEASWKWSKKSVIRYNVNSLRRIHIVLYSDRIDVNTGHYSDTGYNYEVTQQKLNKDNKNLPFF